MRAFLEQNGKEVVATALPDECCHKLLVKRDLKALKNSGAEAVVGLSCGDGVQTVADNVDIPVYPANNTMFLGQVERVGMFNEYCKMCGDCVLGSTGQRLRLDPDLQAPGGHWAAGQTGPDPPG